MTNNDETMHVLVVDDDDAIRDLLCDFLQHHGLTTVAAENDVQMWSALQQHRVTTIVLDLNLPKRNGIELCRDLRNHAQFKDLPIIMLTAKTSTLDRILGLETGADDYVCKPFEPLELLSRIRSVMRRSRSAQHSTQTRFFNSYRQELKLIHFDNWSLDTRARNLVNPTQVVITLSSAEFKFLQFMLMHANRVLSRDQIMEEMHGRETGPFDRSIDLQISRLRQKIEVNSKQPSIIKTIRNEGYMLVANVRYDAV